MALQISSLQGTQDLIPEDTQKWQYVERTALETASLFGFGEIRTPTIEYTELFVRSVGDTTDVVQKEMYTFTDRGDRQISLKPEGTAGVVRAAIERGLLKNSLPQKLSYITRCYRAERPQRGRYREFNQFGVELLGSNSPSADAEVILLANEVLDTLEVSGYQLMINSIGCHSCRPPYQKLIKDYFTENKTQLCETCLDRLDKNPLRIIDCKNPDCHKVAVGAPRMIEHICEECSIHFEGVKARLDAAQVKWQLDPNIVRGLDYYTKTVFEFITHTKDGDLTLCGGGRYDGLVEMIGGPATQGVGFGMGLERLIMTMEDNGCPFPEAEPCLIYIAPMCDKASIEATKLVTMLRREGVICDHDTVGRSLKAQMRYANKIGALYTMVLGDDELATSTAKLKKMADGTLIDVELDDGFAGRFALLAITESLMCFDEE